MYVARDTHYSRGENDVFTAFTLDQTLFHRCYFAVASEVSLGSRCRPSINEGTARDSNKGSNLKKEAAAQLLSLALCGDPRHKPETQT